MGGVFVTGATGTVGSALVRQLLERGEPVVAGVRDPGAGDALPAGVERRAFSFDTDLSSQERVLSGCDRLFLMRPPAISDVQRFLFPTIDAARTRRVRQVAFLSLQGVQGNRSTPHHAVEAHLRNIKAPWTFLRPNFFMQNLSTTYADQIRRTGEIRVPAGNAWTAFIDARDVAAAAAVTLSEGGHLRNAYTLSGERALRYGDVARIMTEVLGRPIRYARPREREYLEELRAQGFPEDYVDVQKMIYRVVRLNVSALPSRQVRRLTGRPATTFEQFVADHRDAWAPTTAG